VKKTASGSTVSRRAFVWGLAPVSIVLATGLTPRPVPAQKPEPTTVRWGGTTSIELQTPLYVALSRGFLAEEGLKLDGVMLAPGPRVREALAANELDFGDVGTFTYIVGRRVGLPQRIIFEYYSKEIFSLFVPAKFQGQIKSVADLKGKTVAVTAQGASTHMAGLSFVRKAGLKDADVKFVGLQSGDPAVWITAFEQGNFDAGIVWEPISTYLIARKAGVPLVDVRDREAHDKWVGKSAASMVLSVNEDLIAKRPEVIQKAVRALRKALAYIRNHSAAEVAAAAAPHFKMEPALLARVLEPIKGNFSADGRISRSGIAVEVDLALAGGILKQRLSFEEMVDTRFAGSTD
jgi:NitT/TauT family transport system substrate-binding protein